MLVAKDLRPSTLYPGGEGNGDKGGTVVSVSLRMRAPPEVVAAASCRLVRLIAPLPHPETAKTGISFAGLTFDGSVDGRPIGERREEAVPCVADGKGGLIINATLPRLSAAIVTCRGAKLE